MPKQVGYIARLVRASAASVSTMTAFQHPVCVKNYLFPVRSSANTYLNTFSIQGRAVFTLPGQDRSPSLDFTRRNLSDIEARDRHVAVAD